MTSTALFVELIIIGVQTNTWILLLVLISLPTDQLSGLLVVISEATALIITMGIPWLYTIGIIMDRVCDRIFWFAARPLLARRQLTDSSFKDVAVTVIEKSSGSSYEIYKYYLSRLRIMRAAGINIPLVCFLVPLLLPINIYIYSPLMLVIIGVTAWSYFTVIDRYFDRTLRIYENINTIGVSNNE